MRVGIIVYGLDRPLTGIGRYTLELVRTYDQLTDRPEFVLLTAGGLGALSDVSLPEVPLRGCRLLPGLLTIGHGLIPLLARQHKLDVIHDLTAATPMALGAGGAKIVSTVHDVIPWSLPGNSALADDLIYRCWLPLRLPSISRVITVSQHSKSEIIRFMKLKPEKIGVIPYGIRSHFRPVPEADAAAYLRTRYQLDAPYILYVGNLTKRKNIQLALEAFAQIAPDFPDLRFVLAGPRVFQKTPVEEIVARLGIGERIKLTGPANDTDLPHLYSAAAAFVFPSFYEGFGLPPLEAMACGAPTVVSNTSSLPEVVGDAALQVDPNDAPGLADALRRILTETALRDALRQKGIARAAQFTWEATARATIRVYEQVLQQQD
jgi:glycosyltransferase involved in cell wall biosynthesis